MLRTLLLSALVVTSARAATGIVEGTLEFGKGPFVVYVDEIPGATFPAQAPAPVLGQKHNTYVPHILPIVVGSQVELRSSDPELHNVYAWALALQKALFNIAILPGAPSQSKRFNKTGVVRITCNVHKEMLAYILVLQNPHFALVDRGTSTFRLVGVPAGKYQLRVWGEKLGDDLLGRRFPVEVSAGQTIHAALTQ